MDFSILDSILVLLMIGISIASIFHYFRLPIILGYLSVGVLVGPHALGWVANTDNIRALAEFGVVFLMFTVGLEFSLSKLLSMRRSVFLFGGIQVLMTILVVTTIGIWVGMTFTMSLVIGTIAAMSSTAIVTKLLTDRFEINTPHGNHAVGILLFQDLAVVPAFILLSILGDQTQLPVTQPLLLAFINGIIAISIILAAGRFLIRPLFEAISSTHSTELFTLTALFTTLGAAWLTHRLGLSLALGAFMAGIMLSETEYRYQIEAEIRPFRDVLLGLFFTTIGMLLNVQGWLETWPWILLMFSALVFGKGALIFVLGKLLRLDSATALRTGLILGQGSEFGFALLTLALSKNILPPDYGQVILGGLLLSIGLAPILIRFNEPLARRMAGGVNTDD